MTSKSKECYAAVFKYIEEHVFEMQPDEIITDFEEGLMLNCADAGTIIVCVFTNSLLGWVLGHC